MNTLLIQHGTVIDPASGLNGKYDLVIDDGKIAGIYAAGDAATGKGQVTVINASGCLVTPGLIDIHTHVFPDRTALGIEADRVGVRQGVVAVVDAGSAGACTFARFVDEVADRSVTRVLAWLNIAAAGLCAGNSELTDLNGLDIARTVACIRQYRSIRGIKARMSSSVLGASGIKPLEIAKRAAWEAHVPLMVHIGNGPPALEDILDLLDKGDVVTHAFHGKAGGIFNKNRELIPQARKALDRGVLLDVGHGTSSFSFQTMLQAKAAGVKPHTISTDIYAGNYQGPVYSLMTTLSKFLALGYSLEEVIAASTVRPASLLGLSDCLGTLAVGRPADISIMAVTEGNFDFIDSENCHFSGHRLLQPQYTLRTGKVLTAND